jgi:histidine triad (HIT) family protein
MPVVYSNICKKPYLKKLFDREIPADIIYEDDICMAFLDLFPVKKGHTLLISKKPYPWIQDVPVQELSHIMGIAQDIIKTMKIKIHADYVQLGVVGTEIPHFHIHLIPHLLSDRVETSHDRPVDSYKDDAERQLFVKNLTLFQNNVV